MTHNVQRRCQDDLNREREMRQETVECVRYLRSPASQQRASTCCSVRSGRVEHTRRNQRGQARRTLWWFKRPGIVSAWASRLASSRESTSHTRWRAPELAVVVVVVVVVVLVVERCTAHAGNGPSLLRGISTCQHRAYPYRNDIRHTQIEVFGKNMCGE